MRGRRVEFCYWFKAATKGEWGEIGDRLHIAMIPRGAGEPEKRGFILTREALWKSPRQFFEILWMCCRFEARHIPRLEYKHGVDAANR